MANKFLVKLRKSGNSYIVTIPSEILQQTGWQEKDQIYGEVTGKKVVLEKV